MGAGRPLTVLLLVFLETSGSRGYRKGAPLEQCDDMMPGHYGNVHRVDNDDEEKPYKLTTNYRDYMAGGKLTLFLVGLKTKGPDGRKRQRTIQGFMLQARNDSGLRVGRFSVHPDDYTKKNAALMACGRQNATAITHTENLENGTVLAFLWNAPPKTEAPAGVGNVTFVATVVEEYSEVYLGIRAVISFYARSGDPRVEETVVGGGVGGGGSTSSSSLPDSSAPPPDDGSFGQRATGLPSYYWAAFGCACAAAGTLIRWT